MKTNPIDNFTLSKSDFHFLDITTHRAECILAKNDGTLWAADSRGGVLKIDTKDCRSTFIGSKLDTAKKNEKTSGLPSGGSLPNGLCFADDKNILIANIGNRRLERIDLITGEIKALYDSIEGMPIGMINFVLKDSKDRIWITVSSRHHDKDNIFNPYLRDGYIALVDNGNIRIVADGFGITNEIRFDKNESYIYIAETSGRHISRMRIAENGSLSNREIFGPSDLGPAGFPDGIAFDSYGNLWGTLVFAGKIFAISPEGELKIIFDDGNEEARKKIDEEFWRGDGINLNTLFSSKGDLIPAPTSLTFAGKDLKTVYVGSLFGEKLTYFKSPVAGEHMVWWH